MQKKKSTLKQETGVHRISHHGLTLTLYLSDRTPQPPRRTT